MEVTMMKFRVIRDYDEYQPQVLVNQLSDHPTWIDIGYTCNTIEGAENVCRSYKRMKADPVVKEFEL
jgi:hypothetical protein